MKMSSENIEKKRANTSVLIRKADAFGAVIEAAAREESETDVLRRIDRIPPVVGANVAYICDGRKCDSCSGECKHTLDVSHAKNFSERDGAYFENEEPQEDQPVKGRGVFIPDVTVDMIRNAPLEGIEELLNNGEMYNVPKPTEANRSLPAGDYISRADAIEAVCKSCELWTMHGLKTNTECPYYKNECAEIKALEAIPSAETVHKPDYSFEADMVKRLRQAEAVQGWIPVEEQPPVFPCLVCDANGNQPAVPLGIVTITDEEHGEWHIDGRLWDTKVFFKGEWCSQTGYGNRIIAWMPLPTPYKGGDSE